MTPDGSLRLYPFICKWAVPNYSFEISFLGLHQLWEVLTLHSILTETRAFWNCVLALQTSVVAEITCTLLFLPWANLGARLKIIFWLFFLNVFCGYVSFCLMDGIYPFFPWSLFLSSIQLFLFLKNKKTTR